MLRFLYQFLKDVLLMTQGFYYALLKEVIHAVILILQWPSFHGSNNKMDNGFEQNF